MSDFDEYIKIYSEVKDAIANNMPVVALESNLISHGMPYPQNMETAMAMGGEIRYRGAVPATIAIIGGKLKVGLSLDELEMVAGNNDIFKTSTRDIPYAVTKGLNGSATIAATMFIANLAGIKVFATGAIGGVHMGGAGNMDISSDLTELSRTSLAVVCSGTKSIIDTGLTLERLDTLGVPVIGYRTNSFPSFFIRESGREAAYRLDTPGDIAKALKIKWNLGIRGGALIANPVPEEDELDREMVERAAAEAIKDARSEKITGKDLTPYLLEAFNVLTGGTSLKTCTSLLKNNARLAAELSVELERLYQSKLPFDKTMTI
jgi:pseudouridine-5'-phosphate glycosidase